MPRRSQWGDLEKDSRAREEADGVEATTDCSCGVGGGGEKEYRVPGTCMATQQAGGIWSSTAEELTFDISLHI